MAVQVEKSFQRTETNNIYLGKITKANPKQMVSNRTGNSYTIYEISVEIQGVELMGKSPFTAEISEYDSVFYSKNKDGIGLKDNFLTPMGIQEREFNIDGRKVMAYDDANLEKDLMGKQCQVILFDKYLLSKDKGDGRRYVNSWPKIFAIAGSQFPQDKLNVLLNDAKKLAIETQANAEQMKAQWENAPQMTSMPNSNIQTSQKSNLGTQLPF